MTTTDEQLDRSTAAKAAKAAAAAAAAKSAAQIAAPARLGLGLVGVVQAAFAFLAFWDLGIRDKSTVRGPKYVWIPVIMVNWIGPAAYFTFGVKR